MERECVITVYNELELELDRGMLDFAMRVAARHVQNARAIDIYPSARVPLGMRPLGRDPGWIEWMVRVIYRSGSALSIGCIQRTPDAEYESHT